MVLTGDMFPLGIYELLKDEDSSRNTLIFPLGAIFFTNSYVSRSSSLLGSLLSAKHKIVYSPMI